jgi:hypothetical protein
MTNENSKKDYKLLINNKPFEWPEQFIPGSEVRKLGQISEDDDLYLKVNGQEEDKLISNDTNIDLDKPGVEHFFSKESNQNFEIIVNGRLKKWSKKKISFEEVIVLAFDQYVEAATMVYTVAYEDGPRQNPEGSMVKGMIVFVKDKMIFHATATDKS